MKKHHKHHIVIGSSTFVVGAGGMGGYFVDKITELINTTETSEACVDLLQSLI